MADVNIYLKNISSQHNAEGPVEKPLPLQIGLILLFLSGLCNLSWRTPHSSIPSAMLPYSMT